MAEARNVAVCTFILVFYGEIERTDCGRLDFISFYNSPPTANLRLHGFVNCLPFC